MTTPDRNTVEQITSDVQRDVASGLISAETGADVVARAEASAAIQEPAPTPEPTPEPTPIPEPTPAPFADPVTIAALEAGEGTVVQTVAEVEQQAEDQRLASAGVQATDTGDGINIVVEGVSIGTGATTLSGAAGVVELQLVQQGVSRERIDDILGALRATEPTPAALGPTVGDVESAAQRESTIEQVRGALATGVAVDPDILRGLNVPEEQVARIEREQSAIREMRAVPGVAVGNQFNLTAFFDAGGSLRIAANAGFNPDDIDAALAATRTRNIKTVQRIPVRQVVGLGGLATDDFAAPTPPGITQEEVEFLRAKRALRFFLDAEVPGRFPEQLRTDDAVAAGKAKSDIVALVGEASYDASLRRQQERDFFALSRRAQQVGAAVPTPLVRKIPPHGELFDLPEDLQREFDDAIGRSKLQGAIGGVFPSVEVTASSAARNVSITTATQGFQRGEATADETRLLIASIKDQVKLGGEISDIGYIVPGLGTFMLFNAVQRDPSITNLAFFATSAFLDVVLFVVPVVRVAGGPVVSRIVALPKTAVQRIRLTPEVLRSERGGMVAPVTEARLTNVIKNVTEAPPKPRVEPPAPVREPVKPSPAKPEPAPIPQRTEPSPRRTAPDPGVPDPGPKPRRIQEPIKPAVPGDAPPVRFVEPPGPAPLVPPGEPLPLPFEVRPPKTVPEPSPVTPPRPSRPRPTRGPDEPLPGQEPRPAPLVIPTPIRIDVPETRPDPFTQPAPRTLPTTQPEVLPITAPEPLAAPEEFTRPDTAPSTEAEPATQPATRPQEFPLPGEQEFVQPQEQEFPQPEQQPEPLRQEEFGVQPLPQEQPATEPRTEPATQPVTQPAIEPRTEPLPLERPGDQILISLEPIATPEPFPGLTPITTPEPIPALTPITTTPPGEPPLRPPPGEPPLRPPPGEPPLRPPPGEPPLRPPPGEPPLRPPPGEPPLRPPPGEPPLRPPPGEPPLRPPPGEPPLRPPVPHLTLPDGTPLPKGVFPLEVRWGLGENRAILNLATGRLRWVDRDPDGRSPQNTFVAIRTTRVKQPNRKFRMGFENVTVTGRNISFERNALANKRPPKKKGIKGRKL